MTCYRNLWCHPAVSAACLEILQWIFPLSPGPGRNKRNSGGRRKLRRILSRLSSSPPRSFTIELGVLENLREPGRLRSSVWFGVEQIEQFHCSFRLWTILLCVSVQL